MNEQDKIANRRYDDIVLIIRHDLYLNKNIDEITIEYINRYAENFFAHQINEEHLSFFSLLSKRTAELIKENLINREFDLAQIIRKINHFTILDRQKNPCLISIRIFPIKEEANKKITSTFYYLIIRSLEIEIQIANFRNETLKKKSNKIIFDDIYNIPNLQSILEELKMLIEFKNLHSHTEIIVGMIEINENYALNDNNLISIIIDAFIKNTRPDDFIGCFDHNKLLIIFYNCALKYAKNIFQRIKEAILRNEYIYNKYRNQLHNLIIANYTKININDNIDKLQKNLLDKTNDAEK